MRRAPSLKVTPRPEQNAENPASSASVSRTCNVPVRELRAFAALAMTVNPQFQHRFIRKCAHEPLFCCSGLDRETAGATQRKAQALSPHERRYRSVADLYHKSYISAIQVTSLF
jgi:hypothetical protein